jgi:ADP-ribose pyrophosphatase YjhB (NUDIX family)
MAASKPPAAPDFRTFDRTVPDGDSLPRLVCRDCGHIHYVNPKIVVGAVISHEGRILLARRAIEPRKGHWTIPAGYMEERETSEDGAIREALEEASARIELDGLLAVYNVRRISQVQLIYRARLIEPDFAPGPESLETGLFSWDEIGALSLAFPTVRWALDAWRAVEGLSVFAPFTNPAGWVDPYEAKAPSRGAETPKAG